MSNETSILLYLLSFILVVFIYDKSYKVNRKYRSILKWISDFITNYRRDYHV